MSLSAQVFPEGIIAGSTRWQGAFTITVEVGASCLRKEGSKHSSGLGHGGFPGLFILQMNKVIPCTSANGGGLGWV